MPSGCPVTPGFPIRTSPDQSSFDSSPRLIAACHVLHRLSTPRHPPCTLTSLTILMKRSRSSLLRRFDRTFSPGQSRATSATSWFRSPLHPVTCTGKTYTYMRPSGVSLFACQRAARHSRAAESAVRPLAKSPWEAAVPSTRANCWPVSENLEAAAGPAVSLPPTHWPGRSPARSPWANIMDLCFTLRCQWSRHKLSQCALNQPRNDSLVEVYDVFSNS